MTTLEDLAGQVHRQALDAAVRQVAPELGVHADELLDSRSFLDTARQLDPGFSAFTAGIRETAKATAEREPSRFLAAPPAPPDPVGEAGQWTMADFKQATNAEVLEAMNAGKLRDLGVPRETAAPVTAPMPAKRSSAVRRDIAAAERRAASVTAWPRRRSPARRLAGSRPGPLRSWTLPISRC